MAVSVSQAWESHTGTTGSTNESSFSFATTGIVGDPKGVLITVHTILDSTNHVSSVTYGGVTAPLVASAVHNGIDEDLRTDVFFLGSGVPTGEQTIVVNRTNDAVVMWATCYACYGDTDLTVTGIQELVGVRGIPLATTFTVDDGSPGSGSRRFLAITSGQNSMQTNDNTYCYRSTGIDFGNQVAYVYHEHTSGQGARSIGAANSGSGDDGAFVALAVSEILNAAVTVSSIDDTTYDDGQTGITITGTGFNATQTTGKVIICPTDDVSDVNAVEQTINGWGDTSINFTATRGTLNHSTNLYLFVVNSDNDSNANGYVVQFNSSLKLKVLVHSSAAGATGVRGVVWASPSVGTIAGAEIGEFTGAAFEAGLESGQAVLKVPVGDFNGNSLTTSDTPVVLVRNDTNTTGIINATIIEE